MNESEITLLQTLVEYYRNKCNKLEYDFLVYKIQSQEALASLRDRGEPKSEESRDDS